MYGDTGVFVLGRALHVLRKSPNWQNARGDILWKTQVELRLRSE